MRRTIEFLDKMSDMYGDGFYILYNNKIKAIYSAFLNAFSNEYCNCQIAYSLKTCFIPGLLRKLHELGSWAEVTSEYEYSLARSLGFNENQIIYNGPYKQMELAVNLAIKGGITNIDSMEEAIRFCECAQGRKLQVGIRCNYLVDGRSSRFGVNIENGELDHVINFLLSHGIEVQGLMCHIKTKTLEDWKRKTSILVEVAKSMDLEYIDVGGGYQFDTDMFVDYAKVISKELGDLKERGIKLILEPGAAICEGTMDYIAKVVNTNLIRNTKYVTVAGTVFDISAIRKRPPGAVIAVCNEKIRKTVRPEKVTIAGFTCLEDDIIIDEFETDLYVGDYLIFENVGAYASSLRPEFIRGYPAIITCEENDVLTVERYKAPINQLGVIFEDNR